MAFNGNNGEYPISEVSSKLEMSQEKEYDFRNQHKILIFFFTQGPGAGFFSFSDTIPKCKI